MSSNWTIAAVRGFPDDLGTLGPKVEPKPAEKDQQPEPVGIITGPDGRMRTNLPMPEGPRVAPAVEDVAKGTGAPVWPFTSAPAAQPDPTGATDGAGIASEPGAHGFMREPLKVGDKVRIHPVAGFEGDDVGVFTVLAITGICLHAGDSRWTSLSAEGFTWERA